MTKKVERNLNKVKAKKILIYHELGVPIIKVVWERYDDNEDYFDGGIIHFHGGLTPPFDLDNNPMPLPNNYIEMTKPQLNRVKQIYKQLNNVLGNVLLDENNPEEE